MKHTITFKPSDVSIRVDQGTNLLDAALAAGVHINASCGGQGVCGKCRVILETGDVESQENENITAEEFD
ncbi:MAG: 2Fe-2S iron-sulfur cluster binding domain-containing protein, partial [Deltaproteobacteria bacterium]|nr:2Fe-2S iron-sulfur cluster binding domain-containing protein [Deltaproteobacteria bacterium]